MRVSGTPEWRAPPPGAPPATRSPRPPWPRTRPGRHLAPPPPPRRRAGRERVEVDLDAHAAGIGEPAASDATPSETSSIACTCDARSRRRPRAAPAAGGGGQRRAGGTLRRSRLEQEPAGLRPAEAAVTAARRRSARRPGRGRGGPAEHRHRQHQDRGARDVAAHDRAAALRAHSPSPGRSRRRRPRTNRCRAPGRRPHPAGRPHRREVGHRHGERLPAEVGEAGRGPAEVDVLDHQVGRTTRSGGSTAASSPIPSVTPGPVSPSAPASRAISSNSPTSRQWYAGAR